MVCFGFCVFIVFQNLHGVGWKAIEILVPWIKDIRATKLMHREAFQLIKYLCKQAKGDVELLKFPLLFGAQHGIHEVVEKILYFYDSDAIFEIVNEENHNAFHLAKARFTMERDQNGNNVIHLVGNMARQDRPDLVSGGVLQLQRDLQWFKQMENETTAD
ncbi:hypothetical protein F0562_023642 [Nyssa sinensis]|uniref:Uncharacterized protein n=1 Tax=Nyssa sinensis TaxID=561372 RepID=A0A5J5BH65_9ASTE|nr:hypothetical protein F0562_023642 [Nyssa sinensis]